MGSSETRWVWHVPGLEGGSGFGGLNVPGFGGSLGGFAPGFNGLLPGSPRAAHREARRRAPADQPPPPAQGARPCPKALAAQKAARAKARKAQAFPAYTCHAPALDCFPCHKTAQDLHTASLPPSGGAPPQTAPPAEEPHTFLGWADNLFGLGDHHGGFYKFFTGITGVAGPGGHGGVVTLATQVVHDEWAFRGNAAAALYQLAQGHPAAAARYSQAATEAMDRNIEVAKNLIPFGGSHGLIAQYGEVVFDNAYGLDDDAVEALNRANADAADQAYNDPVNFALNFVPVAAEGRALLIGRLTVIEREASLAGNAGRAAQAGRALSHIRRADALMSGGKLGTQTRAQAALLGQRVSAAARTRAAAVVAARQAQKARPRSAAQIAAAESAFARQKAGLLARARQNTRRSQKPVHVAAAGGRGARVAGVSDASKQGSHPIGTRVVGMSLIQRMAAKAKRGETGENPSLTQRIKLNRNKDTRPKVEPVVSKHRGYHTFDLAKKARQFRKDTGYYGTSNVMVIEYNGPRDLNGDLPTIAVHSIPRGDPSGLPQMHSEPLGLLELEKAGIPLSKVTRIYTERAPCMTARNYCATLLASELPKVPVYHSFEYGTTEESMKAGNDALVQELNVLKKEAKAATKLK